MTDEELYNHTIQTALEQQVALLMKHWPNGLRNVLSHNVRLFFNPGNKLCVGHAGQTSSDMLLLDVATLSKGDKKADLLHAVSSYLWKRMQNTGSGVEMPNVELPSARKTTTLPPTLSSGGFVDPRNPGVLLDVPTELGPGQGPGPTHRIGPQTQIPQLPPGKK